MENIQQTVHTAASQDNKKTAESLTIPKHRFDCVNLCLKETKQELKERTAQVGELKVKVEVLEKALLDAKVETILAMHHARNLTAAKALLDFSNLKLDQDGNVPGLREQVLNIKKNQNYLFEYQESTAYMLLPVSMAALNEHN